MSIISTEEILRNIDSGELTFENISEEAIGQVVCALKSGSITARNLSESAVDLLDRVCLELMPSGPGQNIELANEIFILCSPE